MRVVLDTNVLVSAVLSPGGTPAQLLRAWRADVFQLVVSAELLLELDAVLRRPRIAQRSGFSPEENAMLVASLTASAAFVEPAEALRVLSDDADNRVLEAAVAGQADYIVSGDTALLGLERFEGVEIVTPARFRAILAASGL